MVYPFAIFAKAWDSAMPKTAAEATKRCPISCATRKNQNPTRFEVEDLN
jgi:hypothetical protein